MTPRERFAINLRKARERKEISQEELGFRDSRPSRSFLDVTRFQRATGFRFTPMRHAIRAFLRAARPSEEGGVRAGLRL